MPSSPSSMARVLSDADAQAALAALASRAADEAAEKAVQKSFFLLGVDLTDQSSIDDFRAGMRRLRALERSSHERRTQIRGSAISGGFGIVLSVVSAVLTTLAVGLMKAGASLPQVPPH